MPRQSNGALRAERERAQRAHRAAREATPRRVTRRARHDEYTPTRADRRIATSAAEG